MGRSEGRFNVWFTWLLFIWTILYDIEVFRSGNLTHMTPEFYFVSYSCLVSNPKTIGMVPLHNHVLLSEVFYSKKQIGQWPVSVQISFPPSNIGIACQTVPKNSFDYREAPSTRRLKTS